MFKRMFVVVICMILFLVLSSCSKENVNLGQEDDYIEVVESWINKIIDEERIPGISLVIVDGNNNVYNKGFGYSSIDEEIMVNSNTYFELGSLSKSYTALGIYKLVNEGKLSTDKPISFYIPWFKLIYKGEYKGRIVNDYVDIKLSDLLHHTSGIPYNTIGSIPIGRSDSALKEAVKNIVNCKLDFYPGTEFQYASINYDILGLIIEEVSGVSYEEYMQTEIFDVLGLKETRLFASDIPSELLATGYKINFLQPTKYLAPHYRGNKPAGYILTNGNDLIKWIKLNLGLVQNDQINRELFELTHQPNRRVSPDSKGASYASGWYVYQEGNGFLSHGGSNPNYSSYVLMRPHEKIGIGVMANINTDILEEIALGINSIIENETPEYDFRNLNTTIDMFSILILIIVLPLIVVMIYLHSTIVSDLLFKRRLCAMNKVMIVLRCILCMVIISVVGYCIYLLPAIFWNDVPWSVVAVWAPNSLLYALYAIYTAIILFCLYMLTNSILTKEDDMSILSIAIMSSISGLGNAVIVFVINESLIKSTYSEWGLLLYFMLGVVMYVYGQKIVRSRFILIANNITYGKRIMLINRLLASSFEKVESIDDGKILSCLNYDTEVVSNVSSMYISVISNTVTLFLLFIYLGLKNFNGLLISLLVILFAASIYVIAGRYSHKLWEETRNSQNLFYKYINSIIDGFKELKLNRKRLEEFSEDVKECCNEYKSKRVKGENAFSTVFVTGELLFTLVIGAVIFVFPIIFDNIQLNDLRTYVFVYIYMTGPIHALMNGVPELIKMRISNARINELINEIGHVEYTNDYLGPLSSEFELELRNVKYEYKSKEKCEFEVGPLNISFRSDEITFIIGGNGSGKTTLVKLLTGLYTPDEGSIYLNGQNVVNTDFKQNCSVVFSDYFLFEKLYGIEHDNYSNISILLEKLKIANKIDLNNNRFNTLKLSSGQRKRLALLVSFLEDRRIFVFDEWAADQDPEFRKFFYEYLIPELKSRNKCIIAITHDDRYYRLADRVIKMENGKVVR